METLLKLKNGNLIDVKEEAVEEYGGYCETCYYETTTDYLTFVFQEPSGNTFSNSVDMSYKGSISIPKLIVYLLNHLDDFKEMTSVEFTEHIESHYKDFKPDYR